jgi:hypothetical protein
MVRPSAWAVFSRVEGWRQTPSAPLGCRRRFQLRARLGWPSAVSSPRHRKPGGPLAGPGLAWALRVRGSVT